MVCCDLGDVLAEEAADRRLHAVRGVRVEGGLEALRLLEQGRARAERRVDGAVEDEPADAVRGRAGRTSRRASVPYDAPR